MMHTWSGDRCADCGARRDWPIADKPCSLARPEPRQKPQRPPAHRGRAHPSRQRGRSFVLAVKHGSKSPLRLAVEAAGMRWELYRDRRRRGLSHEDAMAGVDRRRARA